MARDSCALQGSSWYASAMRRSRSLFILLLASATAASLIGVPACAGLKHANTSGDDAGTRVDGAPTDATSPGDAEVNADGGPVRPLDDTACDGANKWSAESKSDAKCIGRKVRLLESWSGGDGAFGSTSTSIVRAVNGRTGVAVHRIQGVEEGELRIFAMSNTAEGFAVPPPFRITGSQFEDFGVGNTTSRHH